MHAGVAQPPHIRACPDQHEQHAQQFSKPRYHWHDDCIYSGTSHDSAQHAQHARQPAEPHDNWLQDCIHSGIVDHNVASNSGALSCPGRNSVSLRRKSAPAHVVRRNHEHSTAHNMSSGDIILVEEDVHVPAKCLSASSLSSVGDNDKIYADAGGQIVSNHHHPSDRRSSGRSSGRSDGCSTGAILGGLGGGGDRGRNVSSQAHAHAHANAASHKLQYTPTDGRGGKGGLTGTPRWGVREPHRGGSFKEGDITWHGGIHDACRACSIEESPVPDDGVGEVARGAMATGEALPQGNAWTRENPCFNETVEFSMLLDGTNTGFVSSRMGASKDRRSKAAKHDAMWRGIGTEIEQGRRGRVERQTVRALQELGSVRGSGSESGYEPDSADRGVLDREVVERKHGERSLSQHIADRDRHWDEAQDPEEEKRRADVFKDGNRATWRERADVAGADFRVQSSEGARRGEREHREPVETDRGVYASVPPPPPDALLSSNSSWHAVNAWLQKHGTSRVNSRASVLYSSLSRSVPLEGGSATLLGGEGSVGEYWDMHEMGMSSQFGEDTARMHASNTSGSVREGGASNSCSSYEERARALGGETHANDADHAFEDNLDGSCIDGSCMRSPRSLARDRHLSAADSNRQKDNMHGVHALGVNRENAQRAVHARSQQHRVPGGRAVLDEYSMHMPVDTDRSLGMTRQLMHEGRSQSLMSVGNSHIDRSTFDESQHFNPRSKLRSKSIMYTGAHEALPMHAAHTQPRPQQHDLVAQDSKYNDAYSEYSGISEPSGRFHGAGEDRRVRVPKLRLQAVSSPGGRALELLLQFDESAVGRSGLSATGDLERTTETDIGATSSSSLCRALQHLARLVGATSSSFP